MCFCVCVVRPYSHPLKTCPWALVGWTKADLPLSLLTVTTCPLRVWSAEALQHHTCRTRWTDRCLVRGLSVKRTSFVHLSFPFSFLPPSVPVSLGLLSNTMELRKVVCWRMMSPVCQLWWSQTLYSCILPFKISSFWCFVFALLCIFGEFHVLHCSRLYCRTWDTSGNKSKKKKKKRLRMLSSLISGPNHMPMQGPGPGPNQPPNMPSGSMNIPPSSHGSMGGYNHTVPSSQGMPAQSQMNMTQGQPMGNYGPRPNMNMQPNQGKTNTCVNVLPTCLISSSTETIHWLKPCCECKWICVHLGNIDFFCDFICI